MALEKAGRTLNRLESLFSVHTSNLNLGPIPDIEKVVAPKLSEHQDSIYQNEKLFARIAAVYESDEMKNEVLNLAQRRLVDDRYKTFLRKGAKLSASDKAKLSQMNTRLARLFTDFSQNVLEDEKGYVTWIENEAELAGLPESTVSAMASAAKERGNKGGNWAVTNTRSSMDPFLTYADNRKLREQVWRNYYNRGDNGGEHDNNKIITEILGIRAAARNCSGTKRMPIGEWSRRWRRIRKRPWI